VVDDRRQFSPASRKVRRGQLALEDGELQMVAVPAHGLEDLAQALVIADVVADQVTGAHNLSHRPKLPPPKMSRVPYSGQTA
jgi:hypothetical protein